MFLKANWPERNRSCPTSRTPQAHDSLFLFWFHLALFSTITATWRWVQKKEEEKEKKRKKNQTKKTNKMIKEHVGQLTIQMYVHRPWIHLHNFLLKITIDKLLPMPHPHPTHTLQSCSPVQGNLFSRTLLMLLKSDRHDCTLQLKFDSVLNHKVGCCQY